jgi:hypothetical protein
MYATPFLCYYKDAKSKPKPFPLEKLRFFLDYLNWAIELEHLEEDDQIPDMYGMCEIVIPNHLKYITNGEYIYEAYKIFIDLVSEEKEKEPVMYREAIFSSIFEGAKESFLSELEDNMDAKNFRTARALFELYEYCQNQTGGHLWEDDQGKPVSPPSLDRLTLDDWEDVFSQLSDFFFWDYDWELPIVFNFSQYVDHPHWPTFPEYRRAFVWIRDNAREFENFEESKRLIPLG